MALKATIYKAEVQIADLDRQIYLDHSFTIARHPSETDERMLIRLFAFAVNTPANSDNGALEFSKDMWDADEPSLCQRDLTGQMLHWIDVGQPEEKRILRVSSRSRRVSIYCFSSSAKIWWNGIASKLTRLRNLMVWQVPSAQSQALVTLAQRSMQLQITLQDGSIWVGDGRNSLEVAPVLLFGEPEPEKTAR